MTKLLTFFIILTSLAVYGQSDNSRLVGQWEGTQGVDTLTFIFERDSVLTMSNKNKRDPIVEGETIRPEKKTRLIYLVDLSKRPYAIDFVIQETETRNEWKRIKGIFEFLNENQIKINLGPSDSRPTTFDHLSMTMTKKE